MAKGNWASAILGIAALCIAAPATAQTRLFREDSELPMVIEAPIGDLVRRAQRSTDPVPAVLTVDNARFDMELSPRGFSRRTLGICQFPPLRLNLSGERQNTIMQGQNRLKLVTRCRAGANYEQLTVLEYTTYRMFNELTPISFRVRPVRVTYRDNGGRRREETQFNFLIEDVGDLARRNNRVALEVQTREIASTQLDPEQSAIVGLFQFMIGNLDWDSVEGHPGEECCHNGKLLAASATSRTNVVPVPYDFDYSGFVNAPYATPPAGFTTQNVRQRVYRGYCTPRAHLRDHQRRNSAFRGSAQYRAQLHREFLRNPRQSAAFPTQHYR